MLWLKAKLLSVAETYGENIRIIVIPNQFGDSCCERKKSVLASINFVTFLIFVNRRNNSFHVLLRNFAVH